MGSEKLSNYKQARIKALVSAILIYICLGLVYAWSIFVTPLESEFGWDRSETSTVFTIAILAMSFGGLVGSKLLKRFSSRVAVRLAALCMCMGLVLSSRISTLPGLYVCYGVFCGFAVGIAYNINMSTVQRWYPEKVGFVSGIMLMSYGMGSMLLSTFSSSMIIEFGWRKTFAIIGIVLGGFIILCAHWIKMPSQEQHDYIADEMSDVILKNAAKGSQDEPGIEIDTVGMMKRRSWQLYFCWNIFTTGVGLGVASHAATITLEVNDAVAVAAFITGLFSVVSGVGGALFGRLFDVMSRRKVMLMITVLDLVGALCMFAAMLTGATVLLGAGAALVGFGYGGTRTTNSFFIRKFYGNENYSQNFSIVNFGGIPASFLGASVGGIMQLQFSSYTFVMLYFAVMAVGAFIMQHFIRKP